jgi:hypothetical protein
MSSIVSRHILHAGAVLPVSVCLGLGLAVSDLASLSCNTIVFDYDTLVERILDWSQTFDV